MSSKFIGLTLSLAGTLFAAFVAFFKQQSSSGNLWFPVIFILGPWLVLDALWMWWRSSRGIVAAAILLLISELFVYYGVFLVSESSTDAIAYVFKPALQLLFLLPLGIFIGWVQDKRRAEPAAR